MLLFVVKGSDCDDNDGGGSISVGWDGLFVWAVMAMVVAHGCWKCEERMRKKGGNGGDRERERGTTKKLVKRDGDIGHFTCSGNTVN